MKIFRQNYVISFFLLILCVNFPVMAGGYSLNMESGKINKIVWKEQNATFYVSGVVTLVLKGTVKTKGGSYIQFVKFPLENVPVSQIGSAYGVVPKNKWHAYKKKIDALKKADFQGWGVSVQIVNHKIVAIQCTMISSLTHSWGIFKKAP